jgi:ketosteroid isomerase-like protein
VEDFLRTVRDAYRALDRGDILTFLSVLHDQVEWHHPLGAAPIVHYGQVAIVQNILNRQAGPRPTYAPDGFLGGPDHVVVLGNVTHGGDTDAGRFAHLWLFKADHAAQIHAFEDDGPGKVWGRSLGPAAGGAAILSDHLTNGGESW